MKNNQTKRKLINCKLKVLELHHPVRAVIYNYLIQSLDNTLHNDGFNMHVVSGKLSHCIEIKSSDLLWDVHCATTTGRETLNRLVKEEIILIKYPMRWSRGEPLLFTTPEFQIEIPPSQYHDLSQILKPEPTDK
jgi:hypothetical protein